MYFIKNYLLAALLFCSFNFISQAQTIAHADIEDISQSMPEFKQVRSELEIFQKQLSNELEMDELKLKQYVEKVQAQAQDMTPRQQQEAEAKLQKMQQDLQTKLQESEKRLMDKEAELSKPLFDKLNAAIKAVAEANKFIYIIDKKLLLYSEGGTDATAKIKTQLGMQ